MTLSRRKFLQLGAAALGGLLLPRRQSNPALPRPPFPAAQDDAEYPTGEVGRVAAKSISIFKEPDPDSETVGYRFFDEMLNIYYEVQGEKPVYNKLWYRVWGGYAHSGYVQRVKVRFNTPLSTVSNAGQLCEVTVPYTQIYRYDRWNGWQAFNKIYYMTTHWAVGIDQGPDGQAWYRVYDELLELEYHVPAMHLRPVPDDELAPLSPDVPKEEKLIEISLQEQTLKAFEGEKLILETRISSGIPGQGGEGAIPSATPQGWFNVSSKMPSKHMGNAVLTGAPNVYTLPGVPWTSFFLSPPGYAIHGTYWHNNFGIRMSHGCVNMTSELAKWIFRWTDPKLIPPVVERAQWEMRGYGTRVHII
jgi:lipoprotein-anchoring transpeptidase ErfK/SrfK